MEKTNLNIALNNLIKEFVDKLEIRSRGDKTTATGRFGKSFTGEVVGDGIEISSTVKYAGAVDGGAGKSKNKAGGYDKKRRLEEWAKAKGIRPLRKLKNGYKFAKMKTDKNSAFNSMIFAISKSIAQKGTIKRFEYNGSKIFDRVFKSMRDKIGLEVADGFSADLREELTRIVKIK